MLEKDVIQTRGFHNIEKDGKVIGFQFKIRSIYYRGLYASQIRPGKVTVDGEVFPKESQIWEIRGKDYTTEQMKQLRDVYWDITEPATIKIYKEGGLEQGYHEVGINFTYSSSYLPPKLQENLDPDSEVKGHEIFKRQFKKTLIMV